MTKRVYCELTCASCGEYITIHAADWIDFECSCCGGAAFMEFDEMSNDVRRYDG